MAEEQRQSVMQAPITIEHSVLLPGFLLIEAMHDGKKHTVAMLPIFQLPRNIVEENAKIIQLALIEARIKEVGET